MKHTLENNFQFGLLATSVMTLGLLLSGQAHSRTLHQSLNVDACLNDIKKVEAGVSCLFASKNSDCLKNYEAAFQNPEKMGQHFWKSPLPGAMSYPFESSKEYQSKFAIPGSSFLEQYMKYFYRVGIVPPSYVLDAVLIAKYGFWTGGALSWTAYLVAAYLPDKGFEYICDQLPRVGHVASSVICSKSTLRPQAYEILKLSPQERYESLMNPASKIYAHRNNICVKYFGKLARNLEAVYQTPIASCGNSMNVDLFGKTREVQQLTFDGRPHWISDFSIWWENEPSGIANYVMKPVNGDSDRKYRQMAMLYTPSFRAESTSVGLKDADRREKEGLLGTRIDTDIHMGVPPTDQHMSIWLNRPRIYKTCDLPVID